jgi:hypothetical protein
MDGFLGEVAMENVWTMNQPKVYTPPPGEIRKDGLVAVVEDGRDDPVLPAGFTLRVKPDRRRVQLPIPAALDRRRQR